MHRAAMGGHTSMVAALVASGAPVDPPVNRDRHIKEGDYTPLRWAEISGQKETAAMLIYAGANLDCFTVHHVYRTLLHFTGPPVPIALRSTNTRMTRPCPRARAPRRRMHGGDTRKGNILLVHITLTADRAGVGRCVGAGGRQQEHAPQDDRGAHGADRHNFQKRKGGKRAFSPTYSPTCSVRPLAESVVAPFGALWGVGRKSGGGTNFPLVKGLVKGLGAFSTKLEMLQFQFPRI
eukprot:1180016-Prorocentrum_minimum.AAC.2